MSTTQRSESINAFFYNYIHPNNSLIESVEQYENTLGKKVQIEEEVDARCKNVGVQIINPFPIEEQYQEAYTLEKLKKVREQIALKIGVRNIIVGPVVDGISKFTIFHSMIVCIKKPKRKEFVKFVKFVNILSLFRALSCILWKFVNIFGNCNAFEWFCSNACEVFSFIMKLPMENILY